MDAWQIFGLVASSVQIVLLLWILFLLRDMRSGSRAALQNVQLQLAFVAGRIGLRNQDLQASAVRANDTEQAPSQEVIGGIQWDDFEELVERVQRGEVTTEEPRGAR